MIKKIGFDKRGFWYNYQIKEYEFIETPQDFSPYIPQYPATQARYKLYREMGKTPIEAATLVLTAVCGVKHEENNENTNAN